MEAIASYRIGFLAEALPALGPRMRAAALSLGAVLLWATWPTLAGLAAPAPPFLVFGLAAAVGFAVSLARATARGEVRAFVSTRPRTLAIVTVGLLTNNILYLLAMPRIGPAEANVIAYLWPIMLVVIMARIRRERLQAVRWFGFALSFLGAVLAIAPTFERGFDPTGALLAFGSGLAFAVYSAVRSGGRETHDVIGPSMGLIALLSLSTHLMIEAPSTLAPVQMLAIAGIGLAPLTLSNTLWDRATRTGHTALVSSIAYLTPLVALLLLALFGAGVVTTGTMVGAMLVVAGALSASGLLPTRSRG
ncbi:DMT family transporter [Chelativorans sp.]|uniref:DMT family transporter n=1 Tax=Chelativorans sp. TaxID=2203393 RepID=UPI002810CC09|nr:DMT family transporter [Chelativorans sp.]